LQILRLTNVKYASKLNSCKETDKLRMERPTMDSGQFVDGSWPPP